MRRRRTSAFVFVLLVGLAGCRDARPGEGGTDDDVGGSESSGHGASTGELEGSSTGEPEVPDACADACIDLASEIGVASCHACRCKVAFDDWLPSVEELQCSNGEPIVTYHANVADADYTLELSPPGAIDCANPSLLTTSCRQGSKLGHITHGDVSMYWICRDPYLDFDGSVLYGDMAVIGHNMRSGATCFWDDIDDVIHEDDAPALDLGEASEDERARFAELFAYHDGSTCVACHDHDPFIYTPYLQSTNWQSVAAAKGPYHLVTLAGTARPTGVMHLVSPEAAACTSCHRLGSVNTCSYFAPDALASHKIDAYEAEVEAAAEPGSPHWPLAYWMPGETQPQTDFEQWEVMFGVARDHVLDCCEAPGVSASGCEWEPVPAQ